MLNTVSYLDNLNAHQRSAVEAVEGPVLVLAGAGTGKTKALTTRIAHILLSGKALPGQILAVTFTNKAAHEMKERITALVGDQTSGLWVGTFHSIGARILRQYADLLDFTKDFTIIDVDDQLRLIKQTLAELSVDTEELPPKAAHHAIQRFKDKGLTPEQLNDKDSLSNVNIRRVYQEYQRRLKQLNAMDFGDLLLFNLTLLTEHETTLHFFQERFRYILVDEYQDTNISQYLWLRLLAQKHKNICCVGDDDQSIYGWRGAEVGNILKYEKDFANATVIRLEQNYRSTASILAVASSIISHNSERLGKTLWTDADGGEKVNVTGYYNNYDECNAVANKISALHSREHLALKNIAILVRASSQTRGFEEAFLSQAIPYKVVGGLRFYERKEIRDVIAYIRLMVNRNDDLAFERIINVPKRGIGPSTVQAFYKTASAENISMVEAARKLLDAGVLRPKVASTISTFLNNFVRWSKLRETHHHSDVVEMMVKESGYFDMWQHENTPEADARIDNIIELIRALGDFDTISAFLEHVSLVTDSDAADNRDMVNIMTLHAAKGLEFDAVFLPGWEEGLFPNQRTLNEGNNTALEEERRLAYVGVTRARRLLYISYAASRRVFKQQQTSPPSRFLNELPEEHVQFEGHNSMGGYGAYGDYAQKKKTSASWDSLPSSSHSINGIIEGDRIFHQKFGYGSVTNIDGDHLDISFEKAGAKTLIAKYVEKA